MTAFRSELLSLSIPNCLLQRGKSEVLTFYSLFPKNGLCIRLLALIPNCLHLHSALVQTGRYPAAQSGVQNIKLVHVPGEKLSCGLSLLLT